MEILSIVDMLESKTATKLKEQNHFQYILSQESNPDVQDGYKEMISESVGYLVALGEVFDYLKEVVEHVTELN